MVFFNGNVHIFISISSVGQKRVLVTLSHNFKRSNIMGNEIITAGSISFVITLIGLALGFALLKLQGE